jgi:enoyl-CoA hydratase
MEPELVKYRVDNGVAVMELHNPPANAYSYAMFRQLDDAILRARMDDGVHVIVLTGSGDRFFCAGADIAMLEAATPEFKYYFCLHANETLLRLENTPKLVIAAINGHCVGGGLEVALACDLRVGREGAGKVGLPEVALGVLPGTGGTQRLTRILGRAKALELMVKGDSMSIYEAHAAGLVTSIVSGPDFWPQVMELARSYCPPGKAAKAVGHIKRAVHAGADLPLESGLAIERELQQKLFTSEDAREGLAAFTGKRTPEFRGR